MAEVQNVHANGASEVNGKKRKGFWSNIFHRSSNAKTDEQNKDDQEPKRKGFMNSLASNAEQAVAKEVMHVAEHEATKQIEAHLNNNDNGNSNGPQPTTTTDPTAAASETLSAPTNWAKRMVDSAQQKVQNLQQGLAS